MPPKTNTRQKRKGKPHAVETRGRKTLLTPELQVEIEQILKEGHYQSVAIDIVGISTPTYYGWLKLGEAAEIKKESGELLNNSENQYLEFFNTVKKAKAYGIRRDINRIDVAGEKDWHAIAWKRERMNPELFALQAAPTRPETVVNNINITKTEVKVELSNANAGTVLDIMAECGAIPPPDRGAESEAKVE